MFNYKQNIGTSLAKELDVVALHVLSIKSGLDVVPLMLCLETRSLNEPEKIPQ